MAFSLIPLRCPFCGAEPAVKPWHGGSDTKTAVMCENEDCHAQPMVTAEDKKTAVKVWNTRV